MSVVVVNGVEWNWRFLAYCAANGHRDDPDGMLAEDRERWPGGIMVGFTQWNSGMITQWAEETGVERESIHWKGGDYDAWLREQVATGRSTHSVGGAP